MEMTLLQIQTLTLKLLEDDGTYYPASLAAINEGQRLFCLLTLCLEATATFNLSAELPFYHMQSQFKDWLVPRRFRNSNGQRLRSNKLIELDAAAGNWQAATGTPVRYSLNGFDFLAIYPQPSEADYLTATYARSPTTLVLPTDVPEIRENSHYALANYAAYTLRTPEGGQELAKFVGYLNDFLDEAQAVAALVKAKNLDARYEVLPFELATLDRSQLTGR
jgi:hypothetical protein